MVWKAPAVRPRTVAGELLEVRYVLRLWSLLRKVLLRGQHRETEAVEVVSSQRTGLEGRALSSRRRSCAPCGPLRKPRVRSIRRRPRGSRADRAATPRPATRCLRGRGNTSSELAADGPTPSRRPAALALMSRAAQIGRAHV